MDEKRTENTKETKGIRRKGEMSKERRAKKLNKGTRTIEMFAKQM